MAVAALVAFLLANAVAHGVALAAAGPLWRALVVVLPLAAVAGLVAPRGLEALLGLFGASFLLYGFHAYRPETQAFEYLVALLALAVCLDRARTQGPAHSQPPWLGRLWLLYAAVAVLSLALLPQRVLAHRAFVEGPQIVTAVLTSFPKDPLYAIASADRLLLAIAFAMALARHPHGVRLYRALFRGIAWAALLAALLGVLDFFGWLSLSAYNRTQLFYGVRYRRLQSTFGNPGWFACFVTCVLPLVVLEFWEAGRRLRVLIGALLPVCALALFLSAARASWLVSGFAALTAAALVGASQRWEHPLPRPGRSAWVVLALMVLAVSIPAFLAATPWAYEGSGLGSRTGGLVREMHLRGLGLNETSPRRLTAAYALQLFRQGPLFGLGHDTYNMHLRAQLAVPESAIARLENTAARVDASQAVFDDAHSTYLQILAGTGVAGLTLWLAVAAGGLFVAWRALRQEASPAALCALLVMLAFHAYGLFQGMQYIPMTAVLLPLAGGFSMIANGTPLNARETRLFGAAALAFAALVVAAGGAYLNNRGFRSLKEQLGVTRYLPEERETYEGFYRPESLPQGEFRWMRRRAIVDVERAAPFRLAFVCAHPDAAERPVVLTLRLDGHDAGAVVFRHRGIVEKRFAPVRPGALRLEVSRTFEAREQAHTRELGVAVSAIRWE